MKKQYAFFTRSAGTLLLLLSVSTAAQGFEEDTKSLMTIKGKVVCMDCNPETVAKKQPQPDGNLFYQIKHRKDENDRERQLIINTSSMDSNKTQDDAKAAEDDTDNLRNLTGLNQSLSVRGEDKVVDKLFATSNLDQEVEITGVVRSDNTFDVAEVKVGNEILSQADERSSDE